MTQKREAKDSSALEFLLATIAGSVIGGLLGFILWNGCFISALWVEEAVRRKGIGKRLLAMPEKVATQNQCQHIHLDTFDFQAPGFYEKQGCRVFGAISDYPMGHKRYYLVKHLGEIG
jgi:ribosomal protein S18 acetylase RimI-like enzyme